MSSEQSQISDSQVDYIRCTLCEGGGTFATASESAKVPCDVRYFSKDIFTVWRCRSCGSLHSKEAVDLFKYYAQYPFRNHQADLYTRVGYWNRLRRMKAVGISESDSVLDFGCGKGLYVDYLRARGFKTVSGFDAFIPEYADKNTLARQYDVVTSYDVIEHVDDPIQYFKQLVSLVRPGGKLVLGTPNASYIPLDASRDYPLNGKGPVPDVALSQPWHRHIFSEPVLLDLGRRFKLTPIQLIRRFYFDTLIPTVSTRFVWSYIQSTGGFIDVAVEPLRLMPILTGPKLLFYAFFGYFFPPRNCILVTFEKPNKGSSSER